MKIRNILIFSLMGIVLTAFLLVPTTGKNTLKIDEIPYTWSHTKAVCDSDNYCEDIEIFCKEKEIVKWRFTGYAIKFPETWQDQRDEKTKNKIC